MNDVIIFHRLATVTFVSRIALGLVWLYEGIVPKLLFVRPDQLDLVRQSGLVFHTPLRTLQLLGIAQTGLAIWLLLGLATRFAVLVATTGMLVLIVLVASGNPGMLADPYGALVKDLCLIACAFTVWWLTPIAPRRLRDSSVGQ